MRYLCFIILVLYIVMGTTYYVFTGFNSYKYDYIREEHFATKWWDTTIVKIWEEEFEDEYGKGIYVYYKRPFRNYTLKYERVSASRTQKHFDIIYRKFNTHEIGGDK